MKRLRFFFAVLLFCGLFPLWRGLDFLVLVIPSPFLFAVAGTGIFTLCFLVPLHLLRPEFRKIYYIPILGTVTTLMWYGSPLSEKATMHFELRHCGLATFSGLIYPIRSVLPPAHLDDIEARNQFCWIRKMITQAPEDVEDVNELQNYLDLIRKKLLSPEHKYKASLPLIALLHGRLSASLSGTALENVEVGKLFVDSLHFWRSQYTEEISKRDYPWWNWPHSSYIQWEYGLIEDNWESVIENVKIEN